MKPIDAFLSLLIPGLILLHLLVAPYTKVEESFNIQATHDIATYGLPTSDIPVRFQAAYDHFSFPGAVPRTFVGALVLAALSRPVYSLAGIQYAQFVVRAVLGLFNTVCLLKYKNGLEKAFGQNVGRWYVVLQAAQFHVIYYASRTLPNMFAFGLTTLAFYHFLPLAGPGQLAQEKKRQQRGICLLVFAGVVFRSEVAVLLFTQLLYLLVQGRISIRTILSAGVIGGVFALASTIVVDSYFWQKPIWPELWGFYYNAVQGKSADWGTSPFLYYFTSLLPKLLLNPVILALLIPTAFALPSTRYSSMGFIIPSLAFVAIYSLQPHKEARFIIYVVPPLTAAASLSASYIWTRRTKGILYRLGSLLLVASILGSLAASTGMLLISSLNYPGGEALSHLHTILRRTPWPETSAENEIANIDIHMDVLSCMTGVTRFQEIPWRGLNQDSFPIINGRPTALHYDKTEDEDVLLRPEFWEQHDYALMENPGKAIGKWEIVSTVFAYAGIEFLRPGDGSSFSEIMERVYAANNITVDHDGRETAPDSQDVKDAVENSADLELGKVDGDEKRSIANLKARLRAEEMDRFGTFNLLRDTVRLGTGGWWVGPRMEPKIRILKRVKS
ncbi:Mannosyltransferase [Venustampulla echinocandica]|uniref:Mannosyltransferase n=1 Tax=Venustampulla echinocandica TaxID=2656787 RepID=A0A370THM6_9HELO|nr:Mannosyltransferase [Venustampulla echinocandica]RDL34705.1 Mannosyltransferase [Venustampulla echinocandica]